MIFGNYPIEPQELVLQLNERATRTARQLNIQENNTVWTQAIKVQLAEMARERGFHPIYTDAANKKSEFILDEVWWQEDKSGTSAVLGIESEWGNPRDKNCDSRAGCVGNDFEKLLQFKAPMKLMIFTADNLEMRLAIHGLLQQYMRRFRQHVAGELYVLIEFSAGQCLSYVSRVERDGLNDLIELSAMTSESERALRPA